jgi:DNA polymerase I-like protein with 3'-5' exonuclease and polymerase domains
LIQSSDIKPRIVYTNGELTEAIFDWDTSAPVVADVETFGLDPKDGKLLGVALCSVKKPLEPVYVVFQAYNFTRSTWVSNTDIQKALVEYLRTYFKDVQLVGHNYAYDKSWLDHVLSTKTAWKACTRLMWHMASAPLGPKPYGLKDAQVDVLGWERRGDTELVEQVESRGGKIKEGGHYLADVDVLGKYACLDAASTALLFNELSQFFDRFNYWWMLDKMVEYSWLLQECTQAGIRVDVKKLEEQIEILGNTREAYASRFLEIAAPHVERLERFWIEDRAAKYTNAPARERFLGSWDLQKKFKLSSDKDKRELFFESMKLPMSLETDGGKPSSSVDAVRISIEDLGREDLKELLECYQETENAETLLNSFAKPWLGAVHNSRLHPRFNPCGTVSYRLSGFKPYLLNAPFDEQGLLECLTCDEGYEGLHADIVSAEPACTAHYSQDPTLLKVFRDGKGDVYLDLALTLFPGEKDLQENYNPHAPATEEVKERFKKPRKPSKVTYLTLQYLGTKYAVSRNMRLLAGIKTSLAEADQFVKGYWKHFTKIAVMNEVFYRKHARDGFIRNVVGRIIRAPFPRYRDIPSRVIQSSAHDCLSFLVMKIARKCKERNIPAKPMIIDCHDSTTWQAPKVFLPALKQVFQDSLDELNAEVRMTVPIRIEMKTFQTLAGLKGHE